MKRKCPCWGGCEKVRTAAVVKPKPRTKSLVAIFVAATHNHVLDGSPEGQRLIARGVRAVERAVRRQGRKGDL